MRCVAEGMHTPGTFAADAWPTLLRKAGFDVHEGYWRPGSAKIHIAVKAAA